MGYIMFMDESGDHALDSIDRSFPIFCLAGCIFESDYYHHVARPQVDAFKMRFCDSTKVIIHSRDIRKWEGSFSFLHDPQKREGFYQALNALMGQLEYRILAIVIPKTALLCRYGSAARHPYHLSLEFIVERYSMMMRRLGGNATGYILAESRGRVEDRLLDEEYQRLQEHGSAYQTDLSNITGLWMEKKAANIVGLQIADLSAYPIAAKVLRPDKEQKAFDVLEGKIDAAPPSKGGSILGYGLKVFPQPTFEHYLRWGSKTQRGP